MPDFFTPHRLRCAALAAALVLLVAFGRATLPSVGHGMVTVDGRDIVPGDLPIFVPDNHPRRLEASFTLQVPLFRPRTMVVVPDDCVERISVNGLELDPASGSCVWGNRVVDIASMVHRGSNDVNIVVRNRRGRTALDVAVRAGVADATLALALLAVAATR
jgi:hypothetical protein